jgi:hypothetical protein
MNKEFFTDDVIERIATKVVRIMEVRGIPYSDDALNTLALRLSNRFDYGSELWVDSKTARKILGGISQATFSRLKKVYPEIKMSGGYSRLYNKTLLLKLKIG